MAKKGLPGPKRARRIADGYIVAVADYDAAYHAWITSLGDAGPRARKGFRHAREALDNAAQTLKAAEHAVAKARYAVVQRHCPDWCDAGRMPGVDDHGHADMLSMARAIASGREFVHTRRFDDPLGLGLGNGNIIGHAAITQDGRWIRAWITIDPTTLDPVDAMSVGRDLSEAGMWLSTQMMANDGFRLPDQVEGT